MSVKGAGKPRLQDMVQISKGGWVVCLGTKREQTEVPKRQTMAQGALPAGSQPGRKASSQGLARKAGWVALPGGIGWKRQEGQAVASASGSSVPLDLNILSF